MKLEQDVCNGSKREQIYKCGWLWQKGYYAKTKRKGGRGMREGWIEKRFDEVFTLQMGKTPDRKNKAFFEGTNTGFQLRTWEISISCHHMNAFQTRLLQILAL